MNAIAAPLPSVCQKGVELFFGYDSEGYGWEGCPCHGIRRTPRRVGDPAFPGVEVSWLDIQRRRFYACFRRLVVRLRRRRCK